MEFRHTLLWSEEFPRQIMQEVERERDAVLAVRKHAKAIRAAA